MTNRVSVESVAPPTNEHGGDPDFLPAAIVHRGEVVERAIDLHETKRDGTQMDLRAIEDRLLEDNMDILVGAGRAARLTQADLTDPQAGPPTEWVEEFGVERADAVFTAAKQAWNNSKDAPVFLGMAQKTVQSIIKSRSTQLAAPTTLNVAIIDNSRSYEYNEIEVEDE